MLSRQYFEVVRWGHESRKTYRLSRSDHDNSAGLYNMHGPTQRDNQIMDEVSSRELCRDVFLEELHSELSDPIHKRLIKAYQGSDPVQSMESELVNILLEILDNED